MGATIQKWGNSLAVRIPKAVSEAAHLQENTSVDILVENDKIIIQRAAQPSIKELFAGFEGEYEPQSINWGEAVGGEIW